MKQRFCYLLADMTHRHDDSRLQDTKLLKITERDMTKRVFDSISQPQLFAIVKKHNSRFDVEESPRITLLHNCKAKVLLSWST